MIELLPISLHRCMSWPFQRVKIGLNNTPDPKLKSRRSLFNDQTHARSVKTKILTDITPYKSYRFTNAVAASATNQLSKPLNIPTSSSSYAASLPPLENLNGGNTMLFRAETIRVIREVEGCNGDDSVDGDAQCAFDLFD
jgi:hypothetical protein